MKPYCLIIIQDQKLRTEYFFEYKKCYERIMELSNDYDEFECIVYKTENGVICGTFKQHVEEGDEE